MRKLREARLIPLVDLADALTEFYDDGFKFKPSLLGDIEREECRLPRGFRADYHAALARIYRPE